MRNAIHTLVDRLQTTLRTLRAYRWRFGRQLENLVGDTVRMLAQGMSNRASHRMRPIPIRIDERRDTRR